MDRIESTAPDGAPSAAPRRSWFGEFCLDRAAQRLARGSQPIDLDARTWSLLCFLLEHAGALVSKAEIFAALWPDVAVSDASLSQTVQRLRRALGDDARHPRYIETVHRRGFRFIATVRSGPGAATLPTGAGAAADEPAIFIGRVAERRRLAELLAAARHGVRQLVFIEGEAGLGKTALLNAFLAEHGEGLRVARTQCIEQEGSPEPYLPVLEALDRLARSAPSLLDVLRRHAPTWLAQVPWLLDSQEARALADAAGDATRGRMLREMVRTLEVVAGEQPVVLVLEDLHWADPATLDLLRSVAQRQEPAQLMVLGTYQPAQAITYGHPIIDVARRLSARSACTRLGLGLFSRAEVTELLGRRFSAQHVPAALGERLYARSDGNPLFLVTILDHLVERGFVATDASGWQLTGDVEAEGLSDIPEHLRGMIELRLDSADAAGREIMDAASVAALEFRAASVAAALERPGPEGLDAVEQGCTHLVRRWHLLREAGVETWPDGTRTSRYSFRHGLYRQVLYERLSGNRRRRLHQRIGERLEQGFARDLPRVAAELAAHFAHSGEDAKAVAYFVLAARQAHRRYADREAAEFLRSALRHLDAVPAGPARNLQELQMRMGVVLAHWFAELERPEEDDRHLTQIQALLSVFKEGPGSFQLSSRLWSVYSLHSLPDLAEPLADRMVAIAERGDPGQQMEASIAKGMTASMHGRFAQALEHYARALDLYGESTPPACAGFPGYETKWEDAGARVHGYFGMALLISGAPDQAAAHLRRTIELCGGRIHPKHAAAAFLSAAGILCLLGDVELARTSSHRGVAIAEEHSFNALLAAASAQRLWLAMKTGFREGSTPLIQAAWENYLRSSSANPAPAAPLLLADACRMAGAAGLGLAIVDRVWRDTRETGLRWYDAELQRLEGELRLLQGKRAARREGAASFHRAFEIAHEQGARFYELRAATSLARLGRGQRNGRDSRAGLQRVLAGFTEGFETADLRAAAECLQAQEAAH